MNIVKKDIDGSHYYWVDGEFYPSVTKILDEAGPVAPELRKFFINNTAESVEKLQNEALAFGSKMHHAYEQLLKGKTLDLDKDYPSTREKKHITSFYNWFTETKPEVIEAELVVASKDIGYAGTLDCLCVIDGELWIIDFKTSKGIYWNYGVQVAAYKKAVEEMGLGTKVRTGILRTGTQHKVWYEFKETKVDFSVFERIYQTYLAVNGGKSPQPPLIDIYPKTVRLGG